MDSSVDALERSEVVEEIMDENDVEEERETLVVLLTTSPESEDVHTVARLAEAALSMKKGVHIFLMCDGVYNANHAILSDLCSKGVQITLCAVNASQRNVSPPDTVASGSQYDLAILAHESHRFLAFN